MLEGQMRAEESQKEEEEDEKERLDHSRGGNELEDTASPICFHLPNWVKLVRRKKISRVKAAEKLSVHRASTIYSSYGNVQAV